MLNHKGKNYDFGGYATRYGEKCDDGRVIAPNAFAHQDGGKTALVWHHLRNDPGNVLGHAVMEHRNDGVYVYVLLNKSEKGKKARTIVHAGDVDSLSIYANKLIQEGPLVKKGQIREVSLVISGQNPGAKIDNIAFEHGDGTSTLSEEEAIIYSGLTIDLTEDTDDPDDGDDDDDLNHGDDGKITVGDVFATMTETQKNVVYALLAQALGEDEAEHSAFDLEGEDFMKHNIFSGKNNTSTTLDTLNNDFDAIMKIAARRGSLREAVLEHAESLEIKPEELSKSLEHASITDVGNLFPDARPVRQTPDIVREDQAWVTKFKAGANKVPFAKVKSSYTDISIDEARARGWTKGNESAKSDIVIAILKRTTDPTTVYVRSKLDRDDVIDITDFYVVAWMKAIQREKMDEELARASLISDGRAADSELKIDETKIRPILGDDAVYVHYLTLEHTVTEIDDIIDDIIGARREWKGTGMPMLFIEPGLLSDMLLLKDTVGRYIYNNVKDLASKLRVSEIVEVDHFTGQTREWDAVNEYDADLFGIMVNPRDYTYGADRGGQVTMFDDFDIDFNQHKYLMETRASGALTRPKSAMVIERKQEVV